MDLEIKNTKVLEMFIFTNTNDLIRIVNNNQLNYLPVFQPSMNIVFQFFSNKIYPTIDRRGPKRRARTIRPDKSLNQIQAQPPELNLYIKTLAFILS